MMVLVQSVYRVAGGLVVMNTVKPWTTPEGPEGAPVTNWLISGAEAVLDPLQAHLGACAPLSPRARLASPTRLAGRYQPVTYVLSQ